MPRCLMAKKWKAYTWPNRAENCSSRIDEIFSDGDSRDSLYSEVKQYHNENDHNEQERFHKKREQLEVQKHQSSQEQRQHHLQIGVIQTDDEEIDVVGDVDTISGYSTGTTGSGQTRTQPCWGAHSPTAGATAPSPPPLHASGALYYSGK